MVPKGWSETMTDNPTLYDEDYVAWTEQQAEALRAAARTGANLPLDWENLAEEIESLGRSQRHTLHSQAYRIIRHLLKLEYSPARDPRRGWVETIGDARAEIEIVLDDSPSLRRESGAIVETELVRASRRAIRDLQDHAELDPATERALRQTRYSVEQVLGDWFPPDPNGSPRAE
jgi:hypothetical protein